MWIMDKVHVLMQRVQYKWCVTLGEMMSEDCNHSNHFLINKATNKATSKARALNVTCSIWHLACNDAMLSLNATQ